MIFHYEPSRAQLPLREAVDRLFQQSVVAPNPLRHEGSPVPVDLHETAEAYVITASLAGWPPDDVTVTVHDHTVILAGEPKEAAARDADTTTTYHVRERTSGSFQRAFTFPTAIEGNQTTATFHQGVLTLTVPKAESGKPRRIPVRVVDTVSPTGSVNPLPPGQPPALKKHAVASTT